MNGPVRRTQDGRFVADLSPEERRLLEALLPQLRALVTESAEGPLDPSVSRLFPTAYAGDHQLETEFQELVHGDLVAKRLATIDVIADTLEADSLDEDQLTAWMGAVNDIRLVLGTRLDVTDETDFDDLDPDDPETPLLAAYSYLGWLLESIVVALSP